jgi:hypothetical protein
MRWMSNFILPNIVKYMSERALKESHNTSSTRPTTTMTELGAQSKVQYRTNTEQQSVTYDHRTLKTSSPSPSVKSRGTVLRRLQ